MIGASVCVDGVCLTVTKLEPKQDDHLIFFDIIPETLEKTTLSQKKLHSKVNLERSLKLGGEIGGHIVSGHVMGTGRIVNRQTKENFLSLEIGAPKNFQNLVYPKGFISIDGISLTIGNTYVENEKDTVFFAVHIIPETCRQTTLAEKKVGESLNLEIDHQTVIMVNALKNYKKV